MTFFADPCGSPAPWAASASTTAPFPKKATQWTDESGCLRPEVCHKFRLRPDADDPGLWWCVGSAAAPGCGAVLGCPTEQPEREWDPTPLSEWHSEPAAS